MKDKSLSSKNNIKKTPINSTADKHSKKYEEIRTSFYISEQCDRLLREYMLDTGSRWKNVWLEFTEDGLKWLSKKIKFNEDFKAIYLDILHVSNKLHEPYSSDLRYYVDEFTIPVLEFQKRTKVNAIMYAYVSAWLSEMENIYKVKKHYMAELMLLSQLKKHGVEDEYIEYVLTKVEGLPSAFLTNIIYTYIAGLLLYYKTLRKRSLKRALNSVYRLIYFAQIFLHFRKISIFKTLLKKWRPLYKQLQEENPALARKWLEIEKPWYLKTKISLSGEYGD